MENTNQDVEEFQLDSIVKTYLTIRNERSSLNSQFQAKDDELKAEQQALEQVLLEHCNKLNAKSIRTNEGTVIKSTKNTYVCGDWDNFKKYIIENNAIELLQQRISNPNFKEWMSTREAEGLPPGISTMQELTITIRKPTKE
jgi:hypothetical protein